MSDISLQLQQQIADAITNKQVLNIIGGNSKEFYGRSIQGNPLLTAQHCGITSYEPSELVIKARAGTTLEEIEHTLQQRQQMLPFEPPHFGPQATLGGTIACNFSGPRRAYAGAARDYVLGSKIINGKAEILQFGGEVMKNVAGYDVSRLMAGAMGTLGVLLEISLKILPRPAAEITLRQECDQATAIEKMNQWAGKPFPISATAWLDGQLYLRLSGTASAINAASKQLGGEPIEQDTNFWLKLREQQLPFFHKVKSLWRISLPQTIPPLPIPGEYLIEWGGGLRWLSADEDPETIFSLAKQAGGHAVLFKNTEIASKVFQPLDDLLMQLHRKLKMAFDPHNILNPGRLYPEL